MSCSCISNPCIQFTEALTSCGLWRWPAYVKITSICLGPHGESRRLGRRQWHRQTIETLGGCPAFRPLAKESARCERLPCFALPRSHGAETGWPFQEYDSGHIQNLSKKRLVCSLGICGQVGSEIHGLSETAPVHVPVQHCTVQVPIQGIHREGARQAACTCTG